ncbi:MAG: adenosylmethionine--8-amino-7-oxononanoate transaminase, partial [Thermodesulfobacteriota bacterium]
LIIERGQGSFLIDTEGRRYLDGVSSLWVTVHGHNNKKLNNAIKRQLDKISHSTLLGLSNVPSIELADKLINIAPKGLTRVFYSDNGSTAVEIAMKMAFHYSKIREKKNAKFLAFTGAYHGDTFGTMSVGEIDLFTDRYKPLLFDCLRAPYPYCYRCPIKKEYPDCKMSCLSEFEKILKKYGKEISGCVIEPLVEGAAGMITAPKGFLKEVRRLTKKYGVLLIADEVATGFGRTGKMFACEHEGVSPDFLCLAKGITGGYLPLAATLTTEKIYKAFLGTKKTPDAFFHGHTYTGNPLGSAAAIANIEIFEKENVIKTIQPKIKLLESLLKDFKNLSHAGDARQCGLIAGIELVENKKTKKPYSSKLKIGNKIAAEARKRGVIIRPLGDTIVIMPCLSIKESELRELMKVVYDSTKKITEAHKP